MPTLYLRQLQKLNEIAKAHHVTVVLMIDEFQQLSKTANNAYDIEGAIRHSFELSTNITYVFCGSERNLMHQALEDNKRPLNKDLIYQDGGMFKVISPALASIARQ